MLRFIIIFSLFSFSFASAQTVFGRILNKNNEPLIGATVYYDGTLYGTTSDFEGKFSLSIPVKINAPLVISYIGYDKIYLNDVDFNNRYKFILDESIESLKEVIVFNNEFSRKQMMQVFKMKFLGITKAGKKCIIENEEEIYFSYDKEKFVLYAYSDRPIIINNPFLGYKVHFNLISFNAEFYKYSIKNEAVTSSFYAGTSRFEEIENSKKTVKNREKVFKGSFLEFFRNFAKMDWGSNKFALFHNRFQDNPQECFTVKDALGAKQVNVKHQERGLNSKDFVAEFSLLYNKKEQSKIIFHTDNFIIDYFGLFSNYDKIYFSGMLSEKKVGDLLPSNYGID